MLTIVIIISKLGVYVSVSFVKYNNQIMRLGYSWKVHLKKKTRQNKLTLLQFIMCSPNSENHHTNTKVISSDCNVFYEENLT